MRKRIARLLVRLYPHKWRERYEAEMLDLLDQNGATVGQLFDILLAVTGEWGAYHLVLRAVSVLAAVGGGGALVAAVGAVVASALHQQFAVLPLFQPVFSPSAHGMLVHAPPIIISLELAGDALGMLALLRSFVGGLGVFKGVKVGWGEMCSWCLVLLASSAVEQFCRLTLVGIPGQPFYSHREIWRMSAIRIVCALQLLVLSSRWYWKQRAQALARSRPLPPRNILGLNE
jgi:hypothetical protein